MNRVIARLIVFSAAMISVWALKHSRQSKVTLNMASASVAEGPKLDLRNSTTSNAELSTVRPTVRPNDKQTVKQTNVNPKSPLAAACSTSCAEDKVEDKAQSKVPSKISDIDLRRIRESLPTQKTIQEAMARGEDVHGSPKFITEAGRDIGRAMSAADQNPNLQKPALDLFVSCAEDRDLVRSVRAHCYSAALRSTRKWAMFIPVSELRVDDEIKVMAARFPIGDAKAPTVSR
jgi:hypothetical protein